MTEAQARKLGWHISRGAYTGTTDDRADRWYAWRGDMVDRRGAGYPSKAVALAAVQEAEDELAALEAEGQELMRDEERETMTSMYQRPIQLPSGFREPTSDECRIHGQDVVAITPNGRIVRCLGEGDRGSRYAVQPADDNYWVEAEGWDAVATAYYGEGD